MVHLEPDRLGTRSHPTQRMKQNQEVEQHDRAHMLLRGLYDAEVDLRQPNMNKWKETGN
jgi:hypothetical protein